MNDFSRINRKSPRLNWSSESILQALDQLTNSYRSLENRRAEKAGLTSAEARCMMCFNRDKYHTVKGLAAELGLVKSRITRIADGLAKKGLTERLPDPEDRRICMMRLTPDGVKKLEELNRCCHETLESLFHDATLERKGQILGTLAEITGSLEQANLREPSSL